MRYLMIELGSRGGRLVTRKVASVAEVANSGEFDLVVNSTGLAARHLVNDDRVRPLRGQIMRVYAPKVKHFYFDEDDPAGMTYIIPRSDLCILGGTANFDDFSTTVRESDVRGIVQRCAALEPSVATAPVVTHWVGLRPFRDAIRVELERTRLTSGSNSGYVADIKVPVVHNYGQGGSGVTVAWGCAGNVVELVKEAFQPHAKL